MEKKIDTNMEQLKPKTTFSFLKNTTETNENLKQLYKGNKSNDANRNKNEGQNDKQ